MKAIVTVVGKDRVGIIHDVTKILSNNSVNVLDISQTILDGYFTMMMITDFSDSSKNISDVKYSLDELASKSTLEIIIQHEDIFNAMHRI